MSSTSFIVIFYLSIVALNLIRRSVECDVFRGHSWTVMYLLFFQSIFNDVRSRWLSNFTKSTGAL
uniref:Secreted protein n=1 Tax=Ascaris lumbricoides TaxID=6252 RepID=A0A0M3ISF2_ASCLU